MSATRPASKLRETPALDRWPELRPFLARVLTAYPDQLEAVLLYGSRARGEEHSESDYDLAIVLNGEFDAYEQVSKLVSLAYDELMNDKMFVEAVPVRLDDLRAQGRRYTKNVMIDGIALLGDKPA